MTDQWRSSACPLCYVNCGIEVQLKGSGISRIRGDKKHPGTRGYTCQKASRLRYYAERTDRLTSPLRRRPDGSFEEISWDTALDEIADRLRDIREEHGASAIAMYGGGGQGNHLCGAYGILFNRAFGGSYYNALAQEKGGDFWVNGKMFGQQNVHTAEDVEKADLLMVIGCNPWMAHGFRNARSHINDIRKDPDRKMLVVDPRRTETAEAADVHLQLRPGTDAYLLGALLSILVERGSVDEKFLAERTVGWDEVREHLDKVPVENWLATAGISMEQAIDAVQLIEEASAMTVRVELGIQQGRNSTLNSYLEKLLIMATGSFGRPGTNSVHSWFAPLMGDSTGQKSAVQGIEEIAGIYPPNRLAGEILTDHPDRLRALIVDSGNPANTIANTRRVEEALEALEICVVIDVAMTETARCADYVLPATSQLEKWEMTLFTFEFPHNTFQLRDPLFSPLEGTRVEPEIYLGLAERLGLVADADTIAELADLACSDRAALRAQMPRLGTNPASMAFGLYRTLGKTLPAGADYTAVLWFMATLCVTQHERAVQRALDSELTGFELSDLLFDRIVSTREGIVFTHHEYDEVWDMLKTADKRVRLDVPELLEWLDRLEPAEAEPDPEFPYILYAGQRRKYNANQVIRNPGWRKSEAEGTARLHSTELAALGVVAGDWIVVSTRTGALTVQVEADEALRPGIVALPSGYGMSYPDPEGGVVSVGPRVNMLTHEDDCDPIAHTPYHRNVSAAVRRAVEAEESIARAGAARANAIGLAERRLAGERVA